MKNEKMLKEAKMDNNKLMVGMVILMVMVLMPVVSLAKGGNGVGRGNGNQGVARGINGVAVNAVDSDNDGTPDGLEDDDGDGIINRDDADYEKKYVNMSDDDRDGVPNRIDDDYSPKADGSGYTQPNRQNVTGQQNGNRGGNGQVSGRNATVRTRLRNNLQQQAQIQEQIDKDLEQLEQTGAMKRFFLGSDEKVVERAQNRLRQYESQLNTLKDIVDDPSLSTSDKKTLQEEIKQMEEVKVRLQEQINKDKGFGIFRWLRNLF